MDEPIGQRRVWIALIAFVALALAIRIVVAGFTNIVSQDAAVYYLPQAGAIARGDWGRGFVANIPFLYPLLVAGAFKVIGALDLAGQAVSVISGTLVLLPVYFLGRTVGGRGTGLAAAGLAAISPLLVRYSAQGQSDALFGLLLIISVFLVRRLRDHPGVRRALLLGAVSGLAYLVRPEALGVLVLLAPYLAAAVLRKRITGRQAGWAFGLTLIAFLVVAFPQIWVTHQRTGIWTMSAKAGAIFRYGHDPEFRPAAMGENGDRTTWEEAFGEGGGYVGFSPLKSIASHPGAFLLTYGSNLIRLLLYLPRDLGPLLFAVALLTVAAHAAFKGRVTSGEGLLAGSVLFYVVALPVFYTTRRMWVPLIPLLLPLIARRLIWAWGHWPGHVRSRIPRLRRRALVKRVSLTLLITLTAAQALRPVPKYGWSWQWSPEKEMGLALGRRIQPGDAILGHDGRVAFYAGGTHVPLPRGSPGQVFDLAERRGATWYAFELGWLLKRRPQLLRHIWWQKTGPGGPELPDTGPGVFLEQMTNSGLGRSISVGKCIKAHFYDPLRFEPERK